ncbi:MAG: hypothetical protein J5629_00165 [Muribaculaceae bacterium]|nr:hypothetical protein [Muribaculaceae bacterium]
MKDSIKKFCLRTLLAVSPVLLFMAFYAIVDPFHIVHPISSDSQGQDSIIVGNNAGFTSIETYLLYNDQYHYDSFIFGSSMSQNFKASYWMPYLDSTASILHFDASMETFTGIINKMRFLNNHGNTIKNALIVIEVEMLGRQPSEDDILYIQHPATTGAINWFHVHTQFIKAFCDLNQVKYALFPSQSNNDLQQDGIVSEIAPNRVPHLNEMYYGEIDSIIATSPDKFFTPERLAQRKRVRLPSASQPTIDEAVETQLKTIKEILDKNKSNYIIIVPPRATNPQLTWQDLWVMKSIFGEDKVHDFSSHPEFVNDERVYYDKAAHLISSKCKILLDSAYYNQQHNAIKNPYFKLK